MTALCPSLFEGDYLVHPVPALFVVTLAIIKVFFYTRQCPHGMPFCGKMEQWFASSHSVSDLNTMLAARQQFG